MFTSPRKRAYLARGRKCFSVDFAWWLPSFTSPHRPAVGYKTHIHKIMNTSTAHGIVLEYKEFSIFFRSYFWLSAFLSSTKTYPPRDVSTTLTTLGPTKLFGCGAVGKGLCLNNVDADKWERKMKRAGWLKFSSSALFLSMFALEPLISPGAWAERRRKYKRT